MNMALDNKIALTHTEVYMKVNMKEKLTGKSAYIILILLMATILTLSIVSIISAVNNKETPELPDNTQTDGNAPDGSQDPSNTPPSDTPTDTPTDETPEDPNTPTGTPDEVVYSLPCDGSVQKDYSEDVLVFSHTMNDHRIHLGIDISGKLGDPVKAIAEGIIEKIFSDPFMGKTIVIYHGNGVSTLYAHIDNTGRSGRPTYEVKVGDSVKAGQVIAYVGTTGRSTGDHLHFGIYHNGQTVNPANFIDMY